MIFKIMHTNINVLNLTKTVAFYKKALGLKEKRRKNADDGSFKIIFLTDNTGQYELEITWLRDRKEPYDLSDNEIHICFATDHFEQALKHHHQMGCVVLENKDMGVYFIEDPEGYWVEIAPLKPLKL